MSTIINGTDNSATTPAITGSTGGTSTGVFYPASNQLALATNGTTAVTIDTSQNVGIGTTSPATQLHLNSTTPPVVRLQTSGTGSAMGLDFFYTDSNASRGGLTANLGAGEVRLSAGGSGNTYFQSFYTNATERMRIDSAGTVYLNAWNNNLLGNGNQQLAINSTTTGMSIQTSNNRASAYWTNSGSAGTSNAATYAGFYNNSAQTAVGTITSTGTNCLYNSLSDYRLKEAITPITNGLSLVDALKPVIFKWASNQTEEIGFIAHEFQEVIPSFVTGDKDAVDEDGKPIYQAMDSSGAIPLLVAAIQELNAKVEAQATTIAELQAKVG